MNGQTLNVEMKIIQNLEENLAKIDFLINNELSYNKKRAVTDLVHIIEESYLDVDKDKISRAINHANEFHKDQYRDSGKLYLTHPIQVAYVVSTFRRSTNTITAAILHDAIEDSKDKNYARNKIIEEYGKEPYDLVEALTTLEENREVRDKFAKKKILDAFWNTQNVDPLIIKVADTICNLHDKKYMSSKNGFSSKERQDNFSNNALKSIMPFAKIIDTLKIYDLNLQNYVEDLAKR
jgi:(p)ppGpp synthase/HD superfamily hydrolase